MAPLRIRFTKKPDGSTVLNCLRSDGTNTGQRYRDTFFAKHDLTHYAVETTLGYRLGFFGLVAEGWDLSDFGTPWPRGPIPHDADPAELIVGFLGVEDASGFGMSAVDFNTSAATWYAANAPGHEPCKLSDKQLDAIRGRMHRLFRQWDALLPGKTMELIFPPQTDSRLSDSSYRPINSCP